MKFPAGVALILGLALGPKVSHADDVLVFAAASLKTAMEDVAAGYEAQTGNHMDLSFAGSSALARQIEQGAPADIFISANPGWMDELEARGLTDPGSRVELLGNALVLVGQDTQAGPVTIGPDLDLAGLLGPRGHLAMALVDAVPAGIYGKAALQTLGLWNSVARQVAQADNVRAALALVTSGAAPLGVIYATDAVAAVRVSVLGRFPADSHPPIIYPMAGLARSDNPLKSDALAYLAGHQAGSAFAAQGFTLLAGD
ncbi:molybdate ABC transporter substrate-binding protein [Pseudooceanicola algae]|uniref:Molybdate-binding protein ModA n=1 Tax=Pseudooceanicola algae TaxID=1537215 RepID=A0A418SHT9_9RHOB|nr:molybdate ABC transporter substrate-binding protein [Pseudooceanicola algae]QPM90232.1 Molybdate-binding protein ModA [Pseudooceanicola algae]